MHDLVPVSPQGQNVVAPHALDGKHRMGSNPRLGCRGIGVHFQGRALLVDESARFEELPVCFRARHCLLAEGPGVLVCSGSEFIHCPRVFEHGHVAGGVDSVRMDGDRHGPKISAGLLLPRRCGS